MTHNTVDRTPEMQAFWQWILRPPTVNNFPDHSWIPKDSHTLWLTVTPVTGFASSPPSDILPTCPAGRLFHTNRTSPSANTTTHYVALSLRSDCSLVPPHPGLRPKELYNYVHPDFVSLDGTRGPYQKSRIPQVYEERGPWWPFHRFPLSPPPVTPQVEHNQPPDFFHWGGFDPNTGKGGRWSKSLLQQLLQRRRGVEEYVKSVLVLMGDPDGSILRKHYGAFLPHLDPLSEDEIGRWTCWANGREPVSGTTEYVCKMAAIGDWLKEVRRQQQNPGSARPATDKMFLGTWVGSVTKEEHWQFLLNSPLPLYGLFVLPEMHPLKSRSVPGEFHGDEFYRCSGIVHFTRLGPPAYDPHFRIGTVIHRAQRQLRESCRYDLPLELDIIPPGEAYSCKYSVAWGLPFNTYPFQDRQILRMRPNGLDPGVKKVNSRFSALAKATTRPILSQSVREVALKRMPVHPLAQFLPPKANQKKRIYEEECEYGINYPTLLSSVQQKKRQGDFKYVFSLGNNDFLWTDYPWPMINDVDPPKSSGASFVGMFGDDEDDDLDEEIQMVPSKRLVYAKGPPSSKQLGKQLRNPYTAFAPPALQRAIENQPSTSTSHPAAELEPPFILAGRNEWAATAYSSTPTFDLKKFIIACRIQPVYRSSTTFPQSSLPLSTDRPTQISAPRHGHLSHPGVVSMVTPQESKYKGNDSARHPPAQLLVREDPLPDPVMEDNMPSSSAVPLTSNLLDQPPDAKTSLDSPPHLTNILPPLPITNLPTSSPLPLKPSEQPSPLSTAPEIITPSTRTPGVSPQAVLSTDSPAPSDDPLILSKILKDVVENRTKAADYLHFRFNRPEYDFATSEGPLIALHKATFRPLPEKAPFICYPLRFYGVAVDESDHSLVVESMLQMAHEQDWGEVIMVSVQPEFDGTMTVDMGFRYMDDALAMWARDGLQVNDGTWCIRPYWGLLGKVYIARHLQSRQPPLPIRVSRLRLCEHLEASVSLLNNTRLRQIQTCLSDLISQSGQPFPLPTFDVKMSLTQQWQKLLLCGHASTSPVDTANLPFRVNMHPPLLMRQGSWSTSSGSVSEYQQLTYDGPLAKVKAERTRRQHSKVNRQNATDDTKGRVPGQADRSSRYHAKKRFNAWNSSTLSLPEPPSKVNGASLVQTLVDLWDWHDECIVVIDDVLSACSPGAGDIYPGFEASLNDRRAFIEYQSLLSARASFGPSSRIYGLFGTKFTILMQAIADRTHIQQPQTNNETFNASSDMEMSE
ncbi:hypothetical protein FRC19_001482 [Serendipita sp. 401]|nr:hypothetical protein FRC19_001482 [Serendipita sp. 401]KAG9046574.1 hypothetical protein FS842_000843 [Serendipita sp. 407]